ncbi:hypothetical protein [Lactococcus sp. DD01]|uniref:hypothetical protein n=1 Tax=Lactococcus sp. DD01 TaxID=1776443 RepID=UPI0007765134|nr:hypothetical protein [Lactococcus sp. DD01]KXT63186.1 hypothetical protein LACDD01_00130 [Lactococcus sp. DD01]
MDFEEFKKYVEENCNAKSNFFEKMTVYMRRMVESEDNKIYLTESQIETEVKKNWNASLQNMYNKVDKKVTTKKTDAHPVKVEKWLTQMSELEVLDNFAESIDNIEFD